MIGIVDVGIGNVGSIENMFRRLGASTRIVQDPDSLRDLPRLVLPGVGAFDRAVDRLRQRGLFAALDERVAAGIPTLGICLGMQLLGRGSEEGEMDGFGWIPAQTKRFQLREGARLKIPHMGWNHVDVTRDDPLLAGLSEGARFYFVHSYHMVCDSAAHVLGTTDYGGTFHSIVRRENVWGTQFHPEKSHRFGMRLLDNFAKLSC